MMDPTRRLVGGTAHTSPASTTMQTTLYELIAALSAEVGADEADVVTAALVHLLQTHRVTWTGPLAGYRLVCAGFPAVSQEGEKASTGARGHVSVGVWA